MPDHDDPAALEDLWDEPGAVGTCRDCGTTLRQGDDYGGRCFRCAWVVGDQED